MQKQDLQGGLVLCPYFNRLMSEIEGQVGVMAGKLLRECLQELEESKPAEYEMEDHHGSTIILHKEDLEADLEAGTLQCPSFSSYCCSENLADMAGKVFGDFDNLKSLEEDDHDPEDQDGFTFDVPKWGDKVYLGPVFPVFNRDTLFSKEFETTHSHSHHLSNDISSRSISTTTAMKSPKRLKLKELFEQADSARMSCSAARSTFRKIRDFLMPTSTKSDVSEGEVSEKKGGSLSQTLSFSRSMSKKKGGILKRRSWVDCCLGHIRLCFSSL